MISNSLASSSAVQTAQGLIARTERGYEVEDRFFRMWIVRNY